MPALPPAPASPAPISASPPPRSWAAFEQDLAAALAAFDREFLVLDVRGTSAYVQLGAEAGRFRCESVSNRWIPPEERLDDGRVSALLALGWSPPAAAAEGAGPPPSGGSPNYVRDFDAPARPADVARLVVRTLAEVHGVRGPEALEYTSFDGEPGRVPLDRRPRGAVPDRAPAGRARGGAAPRRRPSPAAAGRRAGGLGLAGCFPPLPQALPGGEGEYFNSLLERRRPPATRRGRRTRPCAPPRPVLADGARAPHGSPTMRFVDLSHRIRDGLVTYPGLPPPLIRDHLSRAASRAHYGPGTEFQIARIEMVANTGTYLDAPSHRFEGMPDVAELPLDRVAALPGVVVRVHGRAIGPEVLEGAEVRGRAVLFHTGWDRHFGTPSYGTGHPFLTRTIAEALRDRGAVLVGIDSLNVDDTGDATRPVHTLLLRAGILLVEHLTNLAALPSAGFQLFAVPAPVSGVGSFPVRAFAIVPDGAAPP